MVNAPKPTVNNGQAAEKPELQKNIYFIIPYFY
jgi:hypothetical protein